MIKFKELQEGVIECKDHDGMPYGWLEKGEDGIFILLMDDYYGHRWGSWALKELANKLDALNEPVVQRLLAEAIEEEIPPHTD